MGTLLSIKDDEDDEVEEEEEDIELLLPIFYFFSGLFLPLLPFSSSSELKSLRT